ncbi:hypothetical protein D3C86_1457560 [compost metagenome]
MTELNSEIAVATAIVIPNWRKNSPEIPGMNAVGINTAHNTRVMAINAPPISCMVTMVASSGFLPSARCRSTFSTTTMALSTTIPTASTSPNRVRLLIE